MLGKCGSNMLFLLPATPASGAVSSTAVCPTHSTRATAGRRTSCQPLVQTIRAWCGLLPHKPGSGFLSSCPVVTSCVGWNQSSLTPSQHLLTHRPSPSNDRYGAFCSGSTEGWLLLCVQFPSVCLSLFSDAASCMKPSRAWSAQLSACFSIVLSDCRNLHHSTCCPLYRETSHCSSV